jgi:hypothetical protein
MSWWRERHWALKWIALPAVILVIMLVVSYRFRVASAWQVVVIGVELLMMGIIGVWGSQAEGLSSYLKSLHWNALFPFLLLGGLLLVSLGLAYINTQSSPGQGSSGSPNSSLNDLWHRPGTIFSGAMALVTLFGFIITLGKLQELEARVTDYSELHTRIAEVIRREVRRARDEQGGLLWIMANAPTFGNVSSPVSFWRYHDALVEAIRCPELEIRILCLDPMFEEAGKRKWCVRDADAHDRRKLTLPETAETVHAKPGAESHLAALYRIFQGKLGQTKEEVDSACNCAVGVLANIASATQNHGQRMGVPRAVLGYGSSAHPKERVPLHFVLTSQESVIFNTLDLPTEGTRVRGKDRVEVVAFGSRDSGLRDRLRKAFLYHSIIEDSLNRVAGNEAERAHYPDVQSIAEER